MLPLALGRCARRSARLMPPHIAASSLLSQDAKCTCDDEMGSGISSRSVDRIAMIVKQRRRSRSTQPSTPWICSATI